MASSATPTAAPDKFKRYRLLAPNLTAREDEFKPFWEKDNPPAKLTAIAQERLLFSATLEFGLTSSFGRTLERTGTMSAHVADGG